VPFPLADSLASDYGVGRAAEPGFHAFSGLAHEDGMRGRARSADPSPVLPCLSSNNSTEKAVKLTPYQRKNAFSINENLGFVIEKFGLEKVGFLTLTFPKSLSLKEANRRFNSLATHFLDLHFECWVCVREFTKGGRPHFHLVVVCKGDIRTGFDFESYVKMARLSSNPERRRKHSAEIKALSRSLNPSPLLRSTWRELHRVLPLYQFGRHELIPIRKNGAALARYVGGYIRKSMDFRPAEAKGARLISYSKSFPRKVVGHAWSFNSDGARFWRQKVALFAETHRIKSLDGLAFRFGPRWAWWFRDVIESYNLLPFLPRSTDERTAYFEGLDWSKISDSCLQGGESMHCIHLWRPKLPEIDGVPVSPPKRLRWAFGFHLSNWDKSREQVAAAVAASRSKYREARSNFTDEMIEAARASVLAPASLTYAQSRAAAYESACHLAASRWSVSETCSLEGAS